MEISIATQFSVVIKSIIIGIILGFVYDFIRFLRTYSGIIYTNKFTERLSQITLPLIKNPLTKSLKISPRKEKTIMFITDILFFVIATPIMMVFVYYVNNGVPRWYIYFGAIVGFLLYYFTAGKIFISISEIITFFMKAIVSYFVFLFLKSINIFINILKKRVAILFKKFKPRKAKTKSKTGDIKASDEKNELLRMGKSNF